MWHVSLILALTVSAGRAPQSGEGCEPEARGVGRLECAVERSPDDPLARERLGTAYFEDGRWFEALTQYEGALRVQPANESVRLRIAGVFLEAGLVDEAGQTLAQASAMFPDSGLPDYNESYFHLAELFADRGRLGDARRAMEAAADHPGPVDPALIQKRLGEFLEDLIEPEAARTAYARALRLDPEYAAARLALADLDLDQGRLDEALEGYLRALRQDRTADAYRGIAQVHLAANRFGDAAAAARLAVQLVPDAPGPHYVLGRALQLLGEEDAGRSELAEYGRLQALALAADHRDRELHAYQSDAIVRFYRGDTEEAVAVLRNGITRYPDETDLYLSLGLVLSQSGRHTEAIETYSTLVDLDPEAAGAVAPHLARERRLVSAGR